MEQTNVHCTAVLLHNSCYAALLCDVLQVQYKGIYKCYTYKHCCSSLETNVLAVLIFLSVACWNGAQYYIDIFSERYHLQFEKLQ